eukprot:PITA_09811
MAAIITEVVANTVSSAISALIGQIDDVIRLDENRQLLEGQLNRMKTLLLDVRDQFQDLQKTPPQSLQNCLLRMQDAVGKAKELIDCSRRRQRCVSCLLCKPKLSTEIRKWKTTFDELFHNLQTDFSVFHSAQQIASAAPQQANLLLQDEPDTGLVGLEIRYAEIRLERWLTEAPGVRIFAVYGMGGVGKTALLKKVYNTYKTSVPISYNDVDSRKMKLSAHLRTKKFFLILDDLWSVVTLKELGVEFGENKGSKVVFSTRNRDLIPEMNADQSMQIQPLPRQEAWELFCKVALKDGHVPDEIEYIARVVAEECKGLPLAINVIASTMIGNRAVNEWNLALRQIQTVDSNFPITHPRLDRDLYERLRWSYDSLPHAHLKTCFLYCVMIPEDWCMSVHIISHIWIAEGIVKSKDLDSLMDTAHSYVKLLADRSLFQLRAVGGSSYWSLTFGVHDVVRDMAIYVGEKEENFVSSAGQHCPDIDALFPDIETRHNCRRLSLFGSNITSLPDMELRCPKLVSLFLPLNLELKEIPEAFLLNLVFLRVLCLSNTGLKLLPKSLWQLKQLEYLDLNHIQIEYVDSGIGNLSNLQFLYLNGCKRLKSLPCEMRDLKNLKFLDLNGCRKLQVIPPEIRLLTNCEILR